MRDRRGTARHYRLSHACVAAFPTASLRLHQQAGFRVVGTRRRIGCHRGAGGTSSW